MSGLTVRFKGSTTRRATIEYDGEPLTPKQIADVEAKLEALARALRKGIKEQGIG